MAQITTTDDVEQLGTILCVWAHPDDETFSCGGLMAAARQNGQRVVCITATRGEKGVQDAKRWPPEQLGIIREKELDAALRILGVSEHTFLGYGDGTCRDVPVDDAVGQIRRHIEIVKPDTILTFGLDGMTGHPDHQTVSAWVDAAINGMAEPPVVYHAVELRENYERYLREADEKFNIYFNIDQPPLCESSDCDICLLLTDELCDKKCAALAAMPSQTEAMMNAFGGEAKKIFCREAFIRAD